MKKSLSLKDVSKHLGVSTATISNAFNRPDQLSKELRRRILKECKEIGYSGPSLVARSLRSGKTDVVGVMFADSLSYTFMDPMANTFMAGISDELATHNKQLLLLSSSLGRANEHSNEQIRAESLPDGIIFYGEPSFGSYKRAVDSNKPAIVVDYEDEGTISVNIDNRKICKELVETLAPSKEAKLAAIGMRISDRNTIHALKSSDIHPESKVIANLRTMGFIEGAQSVGNELRLEDILHIPVNDDENAEKAAHILLSREERPDYIFCYSDVIAIAVCSVAKALNIKIPEQLQVTGFDDIPQAQNNQPPLTTVCQQGREKGRIAVKMLLDNGDKDILMDAKIILRDSTLIP